MGYADLFSRDISTQTKIWLGDDIFREVVEKVNHVTFGRRDHLFAADIVNLPWPQLRSLIDSASPGLRNKLLEHGIVYFHLVLMVYEKNDPMLIEKLQRFRFSKHLGDTLATTLKYLFVTHGCLLIRCYFRKGFIWHCV